MLEVVCESLQNICSTIIPISQVKLADELSVKCFQALENLYVLSGIHRVCISIVIYVNVILILAVCIASGASLHYQSDICPISW